MNIDVKKVERCIKYYHKARRLLREIEDKVEKLFEQNNDELLYREDTFEPVYLADKDEGELMRWMGVNGDVIIDENGNMRYQKRQYKAGYIL